MDQHDVVLAGEGDQALHEGQVHAGRGRVVGERQRMTRGLGHADSHDSISASKKSSPGSGLVVGGPPVGPLQADLADVGPGEQRGVDVDRVRGRGHEGGVTGPTSTHMSRTGPPWPRSC